LASAFRPSGTLCAQPNSFRHSDHGPMGADAKAREAKVLPGTEVNSPRRPVELERSRCDEGRMSGPPALTSRLLHQPIVNAVKVRTKRPRKNAQDRKVADRFNQHVPAIARILRCAVTRFADDITFARRKTAHFRFRDIHGISPCLRKGPGIRPDHAHVFPGF